MQYRRDCPSFLERNPISDRTKHAKENACRRSSVLSPLEIFSASRLGTLPSTPFAVLLLAHRFSASIITKGAKPTSLVSPSPSPPRFPHRARFCLTASCWLVVFSSPAPHAWMRDGVSFAWISLLRSWDVPSDLAGAFSAHTHVLGLLAQKLWAAGGCE